MNRTPVESSQIVSVGYDNIKQILEIEFKGAFSSVYEYYDVPADKHFDLIHAAENGGSIGRYFGKEIRGKYDFKKLPAEKPAEEASAT